MAANRSTSTPGASTDGKPVVFLAFANDRDDTVGYLRNLPDEARRLRDAFQPAEQAGLCEVVVRSNSTADDIFKVFQDPMFRNRIAIFHYGGHANGYQLLLESASGQSAAADAGGLAAFLSQQHGLKLVFLNGCSTQQQTRGLLDANISAVISTSRAIDDAVATDFSSQFYRALASGATIRTAYSEAEAAVQTVKGSDSRAMYVSLDDDDSPSLLVEDGWPWNLYLREGSESADQWNLPDAVNDPLFGLPPLPEHDLPESPYRHLNRFTRQDAEVFFGRGHQIRELYDRLTAPRAAPILLFYGQSGVGKSSILDAGLIPRLEPDYEVRYLRRSEGGLLDTLQLAFLPDAMDVPIEIAWQLKEEKLGKPLIVILDQLEELYTRPLLDRPDELEELLEVVNATFVNTDRRPQGRLVLGFRKEWLAELESKLVDHELPRTKVFLEPLDRRGIIEIVQGPSRSKRLRERYGLSVEDGLAESIAEDLLSDRGSAIAPTLQILLTKMWAKATEENYEQPRFSDELYHDLKRKGILLRDFLDQQIAAFRDRYPEAVDSGLLLDIVALHTTPLGTADQQTLEDLREKYAHLEATIPELLQQCQDLHLLTVAASAKKQSTKTTRLAHDTLAPLVREQFDVSDKPGQRARRILDNRSVDWTGDREGRPLDEADLEIVEQGVAGTRDLNSTEQRLLEASRELRAKLQRTRRILRGALVTSMLIIGVAAAVAWYQRGRAVRAHALADANRGMARELMSDLVPELSRRLTVDKSMLAAISREYFEKFINGHLVNGTPRVASLAVLADAKYAIGRIYLDRGACDEAIKAYKESRDWQCEELEVAPENIAELQVGSENEGLANDLAYTLNELGHTYRRQGQDLKQTELLEEAREYYAAAASIREKLAIVRPELSDYRLLHASSVMNIGLAEKSLGNLDKALSYFNQAKETRKDLLETEPGESQKAAIVRHIAFGNHNLADLLRHDDPESASAFEQKAIDNYEQLPREDYSIQSELAKCYQLRAKLNLEQLRGEVYDPKQLSELSVAQASVVIEDYEKAATIYRKIGLLGTVDDQDQYATLEQELIQLYQPKLAIERDEVTLKKVRDCQASINDVDRVRLEQDSLEHDKLVEDKLINFCESSLDYAYSCFELKDNAFARLDDNVRVLRRIRDEFSEGSTNRALADEYLAQFLQASARAFIFVNRFDAAKHAQDEALKLWDGLIETADSEGRGYYEELREETRALDTKRPDSGSD